MGYRINNQGKNSLPGCIKASLAGLFLLLSTFSSRSQDHWTPNVNAFDNYMTLTGYIVFNGKELQSDQIEVGCFIEDECRGIYRLRPMEYLGHPYACFLSIWGSVSDNGKPVTIRVYDHETGNVFEAIQKPGYQYNGDLGTENPYELTLKQSVAQDNVDITAAKALIENATYSSIQANVSTPGQAKTAVETVIKSLTLNGVTATVVDGTFTAAKAGTAGIPSGTNGRYTFTVYLNKGDGAQQTTKELMLIVTATAYTPPVTHTVTIGTTPNGTVSVNPANPVEENAFVTLTITSDAGYELDAIAATKTGETTTVVTLNGSGNTRTFTMPAYDVTVNAIFKKRQAQLDKEAVEEAKAAIEGGVYRIAQATANDGTNVITWLRNTLNTLFGQSHGLQLRSSPPTIMGEISITDIVPAIVGTESNPNGTDGSFNFTVALTLGETLLTTTVTSGVIVATPYEIIPVKRVELRLSGGLTVSILNAGNVATGDLALALTGENADVFALPAPTIKSLAVGEETEITLVLRGGLSTGTYKATLTVSGEGLTPVPVEITYTVGTVGMEDLSQNRGLKAYMQNGTLYVSGLTVGEPWNIYSIAGVPVYQGVADRDGADVYLPVRGVYIVKSGKNTIKVVY